MAPEETQIRDCLTLEDFRQCVQLQQTVWGFENRDLIPLRFFVVAHKIEGQVIGAFDSSGQMVGFCLAVPAWKGSDSYLHSHMLAVLPEYRERGTGRRLKLEQRRQALEKGIRLVEWTFDPFELKNAYFNLERLGAMARRYVPNHYGISSSPLHQGLPTDRLVAEWWLDSARVLARLDSPAREQGEVARRIEVPVAIAEQRSQERDAALRFQSEMRRQFQEAFAEGLAAVGLEMSDQAGSYLLGPCPDLKQSAP